MNLNCNSINFMGRVHKSVYKWADRIKDEAREEERRFANEINKPVEKQKLKDIDNRVDTMMKELEAKAAAMHPDTVITIDNPCNDNDRFLCVSNKRLKNKYRLTPASNSPHDTIRETIDLWKVSGDDAYEGAPAAYNNTYGNRAIELLEYRIKDINEKQTDEYMVSNVINEIMEEVKKHGTDKELREKIDSLVDFQKELGMDTSWVKQVDDIMKARNKEAEIRTQNKKTLDEHNKESKKTKPGLFSTVMSCIINLVS